MRKITDRLPLSAVPAAAAALTLVASLSGASTPHAPAVLEHGTVALATGIRVHYVTQGDRDGIPVIFLHGYSDTWYSFSSLLSRLSPRVRAYALDQRGHGDSDKPTSGYAMPNLAQDVIAFMNAQGITSATIVGHSLGTLVAQQVASIAPDRVNRLVLLDGAQHVSQFNGIDELRAAVEALPDPVPLEFTTEFQRSTIHAPVDPAFVARVSEDSRKLPAGAWRQLLQGMLAMEVSRPRDADSLPTLLIWGRNDAYVPETAQTALLAMWPSARLVALAETGHAPHWERTERVASELHAFLGLR